MTRIVLFAAMMTWTAAAQPPVIRVVRSGSPEPYRRASVNMIAISPLSGPTEQWLLELHDSFGSLENLDRPLIQAPQVNPLSSAFIGSYRMGLSYRPEQAVLAKARYIGVVTYRIQPGTQSDFEKFLKTRRAAMNSVNLDRPDMVYQIVSGEPAGTFVAIMPLPSLKVFDDSRPVPPIYAQGEQGAEKNASAAADFFGEHRLFRIHPANSHVSDDFASADTDFWRVGAQ